MTTKRCPQEETRPMRLAVIGVPTNSSGTTDGVARAPAALRDAGLIELIGQVCDVSDYGDVEFTPPASGRSQASGIIAEESLASMIEGVRVAVAGALADGRFPLVVGGDCPILIGCLAALRDCGRKFGVLFLDGHEDAYPPRQSPTGEAADMELGLLLGADGELPAFLAGSTPALSPADVVVLGARDREILAREGVRSISDRVRVVSDDDLIEGDIEGLTRSAMEQVLAGKKDCVWLHVDLDVLSSHALPAVDYQQPGGLGWEDLKVITEIAVGSGHVVGWNLTIYNPDLDPDLSGARRINEYVVHVICSLFARHR